MTLYRALRAPLFWVTLAVVYICAILPQGEAPTLGATDKTDHIAAFLTLSLLGRAALPARPRWRFALWLSIFGAFIELSQAIPFIGRDASLRDWAADTAAILAGLGAATLLARRFPAIFAA